MSEDSKQDSDNGFPIRDKKVEHQMRMRFGWDDLIEELIQEGQERGAFENLKGAGKPLDLKKNQYAADWDLAHSLMKENDILPPWIEKRNRIVAGLELFRADLGRQWSIFEEAYALARGDGQRMALALQWAGKCRRWDVKLGTINKKIDEFNLSRPSDNLELFHLKLDDELRRIGARRDLADAE
ncbi:MAG: DnaJ family domain-containing protein [Candidatus Promineifilaceae bacterium]|nr:DnaJ family domain-containing protein [Candidatus Promineifilaceae bacterium]